MGTLLVGNKYVHHSVVFGQAAKDLGNGGQIILHCPNVKFLPLRYLK